MNKPAQPDSGQSLRRQTVVYGLGLLVSRSQAFVAVPILAAHLTPSDFGIIESAVTFALLISLVASLGFDSALGANYYNERDAVTRLQVVSSALSCSAAFTVLLGAGVLAAAPHTARLLFGGHVDHYILLVILATATGGLKAWVHLHCIYLRLKFQPTRYNVILFFDAFVSLVGAYFMLTHTDWGAAGILVANLLGALGAAAFCLWFNFAAVFKLPRASHIKVLLRDGIPFLPFTISAFLIFYVNRIIAVQTLTLEDVGILGVAARFATLTNIILGPFQLAWWSYSLQRYAVPDAEIDFPRVYRQFYVAAGLVTICIGSLSPMLISLLTPAEYTESSRYVALLATGTFLSVLFYFPQTTFVAGRRTGLSSLAFSVGALLSIVLAASLTRRFGLIILTASPAIGYAVAFCLALIFARRIRPINYPGAASFCGLVIMIFTGLASFANTVGGGAGMLVQIGIFASGSTAFTIVCHSTGLWTPGLISGNIARIKGVARAHLRGKDLS